MLHAGVGDTTNRLSQGHGCYARRPQRRKLPALAGADLRFLYKRRNRTDRHVDVRIEVGRKAGKTTLLSVLLQRLAAGGDLAGLPVPATGAVVVAEGRPPLWHQRGLRLGFGPKIRWLCRPFRGKPTHYEWLLRIDRRSANE